MFVYNIVNIISEFDMHTTIFLVRHGESIGNACGKYLGHTDLGLSALGYEQANKTAKALAETKIDVIYSSDLKRAHETAVPHAKMRGLDIIDSKELREIFLGDWEGQLISDLKTFHYKEFVLDWLGDFGNFAFPNGESVLHAGDRFYDEVKRIAELNPGKNILITSHAAVIRAFWCKISEIPADRMASEVPFSTNASYSILSYDGQKFTPQRYSVDEHIKADNRDLKS